MTMCTCSVSSSIESLAADRLRGAARTATSPVGRTSANADDDQLQRLVVVDRAGDVTTIEPAR